MFPYLAYIPEGGGGWVAGCLWTQTSAASPRGYVCPCFSRGPPGRSPPEFVPRLLSGRASAASCSLNGCMIMCVCVCVYPCVDPFGHLPACLLALIPMPARCPLPSLVTARTKPPRKHILSSAVREIEDIFSGRRREAFPRSRTVFALRPTSSILSREATA
ncbi:hypothetical protein E2C01_022497 [Portunus trituberculatus]|uniref:Uncharacterized protein n=1 Tax=Portunus trituberculatus TaxID=210409 RepID=A0A5B7E925_PORTR|nr:hypothetical protein [Portunus trituberculatus]